MRKILAVDDDAKVLKVFESALGRKGYQVFVTTDPTKVAEILNQHDIALVMLDIHMPKKSGFEIFKELKKKYQKLPMLFITAYPKSFSMRSDDMVEMWTKDFADGNTDIVYKPFNVDTLYQKVAGLIGEPDEQVS